VEACNIWHEIKRGIFYWTNISSFLRISIQTKKTLVTCIAFTKMRKILFIALNGLSTSD
jgi:hypothetical protein